MAKKKSKKESKKRKVDITKHEYVPKHEVMSEEEIEELLDDLGVERLDLPKILKNDPALKPLDIEEKDVIKITRDSQVAGKTTYYRVVV